MADLIEQIVMLSDVLGEIQVGIDQNPELKSMINQLKEEGFYKAANTSFVTKEESVKCTITLNTSEIDQPIRDRLKTGLETALPNILKSIDDALDPRLGVGEHIIDRLAEGIDGASIRFWFSLYYLENEEMYVKFLKKFELESPINI